MVHAASASGRRSPDQRRWHRVPVAGGGRGAEWVVAAETRGGHLEDLAVSHQRGVIRLQHLLATGFILLRRIPLAFCSCFAPFRIRTACLQAQINGLPQCRRMKGRKSKGERGPNLSLIASKASNAT